MKYFGTELTSAGHFIWDISPSGESLSNMSLDFKSIPFSPEDLTEPEDGYYLKFGAVRWYHIEGYTICAIYGSCKDDRPGSKSVFWVKETIPFEILKDKILSISITKQIIEKMPFEVLWEQDSKILAA